MSTNETWSQADEVAYNEMGERRDRVLAARRIGVESVVDTFACPEPVKEVLVDWLIQNADAVRDALKPYDSGVRVAEKPKVDWIAWCGGDMPLPHGTKIEAQHRNGEVNLGTAGGVFSMKWGHNGSGTDIVAYRVLP